MKTMKWSGLAAALMAAAFAASCGNSTSTGDDTTATATPTQTVTATPTPVPTSTPLGPIFLTDVYTPDGLAKTSLGKCLGFTIVANEALGVSFSPGATASMGPYSHLPLVFQDSTHLR